MTFNLDNSGNAPCVDTTWHYLAEPRLYWSPCRLLSPTMRTGTWVGVWCVLAELFRTCLLLQTEPCPNVTLDVNFFLVMYVSTFVFSFETQQNWSNLPVPVFSTVFHHSQRNDSYLCPYPQAWHCEEVEAWERSGCCEKGSQHEQLGRTCRWLWFCLIGIDTGIDLCIAIGIDRGTDWQLKTTWIWYLMMLDDAW